MVTWIKWTSMCLGLYMIAGCGMMEPKYVQYEKKETAKDTVDGGESTDGDASGECSEKAITAFAASGFSDVVDTKCIACHAAGGTGGKVMPAGEDAANRSLLLASRFFDTTAATFLDNIFTTAKSHGGSTAVSRPEEDAVSAWLAAEAECN